MNTAANPFSDAPLAQRMLELSPAAVVVLNRRGTVVFVNGRLCDLLGYSREELIGESFERILPATPLRDMMSPPARPVSRLGRGITAPTNANEVNVRTHHRDGTGVPVTICLHEIMGNWQPLFLVHLVPGGHEPVDVNRLESERLSAIAQMVSGLAHESRNALQRAVASLDLLELDLKSNPEQMRLSNRIRESLSDLLDNYDEVRRYAQPITLSPQRVELLELCQEAFDEIIEKREGVPHQLQLMSRGRRRAGPSDEAESQGEVGHDSNPLSRWTGPNVGLWNHRNHGDGVPGEPNASDWVWVDREKVKLVMHHLLDNAMDAATESPMGGSRPVARIEVTCGPDSSQRVTVSVRDYGCGFDEASLERAFDPFYTTKQHGTGLGLAICRRIVEAHAGTIVAANHGGGGAVIEFDLPADQDRPGGFAHR